MADAPDKDSINSINKGNQSEAEHQETPPVLRAELQIPHSVIDAYQTDQKRKNRLERWKFRVEILTLLVVTVYTIVAYHQWRTMRNATKATQRSAEAAQKSADAAKEAVRVARDTLTVSREGLRLEQRAWIGIPEVVVDNPEQTSDSVSYKGISLIFRNSGRTPAINSRMSYILISSFGSEPPFDFDKIAKYVGHWPNEWKVIWQPQKPQGVFTPGGVYPVIILPPSVHRGQDRPRMVYIMGKMTYNDIFSGTPQRTTKFCFEYHQFFPEYRFTPCPDGNWMD